MDRPVGWDTLGSKFTGLKFEDVVAEGGSRSPSSKTKSMYSEPSSREKVEDAFHAAVGRRCAAEDAALRQLVGASSRAAPPAAETVAEDNYVAFYAGDEEETIEGAEGDEAEGDLPEDAQVCADPNPLFDGWPFCDVDPFAKEARAADEDANFPRELRIFIPGSPPKSEERPAQTWQGTEEFIFAATQVNCCAQHAFGFPCPHTAISTASVAPTTTTSTSTIQEGYQQSMHAFFEKEFGNRVNASSLNRENSSTSHSTMIFSVTVPTEVVYACAALPQDPLFDNMFRALERSIETAPDGLFGSDSEEPDSPSVAREYQPEAASEGKTAVAAREPADETEEDFILDNPRISLGLFDSMEVPANVMALAEALEIQGKRAEGVALIKEALRKHRAEKANSASEV